MNDAIDNAMAVLFLAYLAGIPISFGYFIALGMVNPFAMFLMSGAWPLTALGWLGFWLGG